MKVLVTAGPTREAIDPVRFISNRSSGKMGYAIAEAAVEEGHEVTLISGPANLQPPANLDFISIGSAQEMCDAVLERVEKIDVLVMAAAVADYRPAKISPTKIKKNSERMTIDLVRTPDILASLPWPRKFSVIGFAAETNDIARNAVSKLVAKRCDVIAANDVSRAEIGFDSDENEVTLYFADGTQRVIPRASKKKIAREMVKLFAVVAKKR